MTSLEFDKVTLEIAGAAACVTLNDPAVKNALGGAVLSGLSRALDHVAAPGSGVRALVLTGAGGAFSSGANLSDSSLIAAGEEFDAGAALERHFHPVLRKLRDLELPLITAVPGPAVGIGMTFALMGDLVLAARSAYFAAGFVKIGLVPDGGTTWLLPRLIGVKRALEMAMLGDRLESAHAFELGLVNRVVEDDALMAEADALAARLAAGPTRALALMRRAFWRSYENSWEQQLALEQQLQSEAGRTKDFMEGVAAFMAKRPPSFTGE
jgi:2-(1,2-epoxy-1,2-dihydrophenyl)acetyl-CoA isomerase